VTCLTAHADGGDPVEDLRQAWLELLGPVTTCPQVVATGQALIRSWAEPARRYHTLAHLGDVLDGVTQLAAHATDVTSVRLAAWYHDAVYNARPDDEANSAARAETELTSLGLAPALIAEVSRLVRLTASHDPSPGDRNGETLCDADLKILASSTDRYAGYTAAVRAEYAHVPQQTFRAGRSKVLRALLDAPAVYRTPHARQHWETQARSNIRAELHQLRAPRDS
jgi:predicted metal-dependent HD superfamily phosphohydrolase